MIFPLLYFLAAVVLLALVYLIYKMLLVPYFARRTFLRHRNVYAVPKFVPVMGDASVMLKGVYEHHNTVAFHYWKKIIEEP